MGADWPIQKPETSVFVKEGKRISETVQRLERMQHLPAKPEIKAAAIVMACSPLVSYLPDPRITKYRALRTNIRRAVGQLHGSWEIIAWSLSGTSLDPETGWVLALLQLWHQCAQTQQGRDTLAAIRKNKTNSRLSAVLMWVHKAGWSLGAYSLATSNLLIPLSQPWKRIRSDVISELRSDALGKLETRRPGTFRGIQEMGINVAAHKRIAAKMTPYQIGTLQRIWQGAAMTKERRALMDPMASPECTCGAPRQAVEHLLYHCPEVEPLSIEASVWGNRPSAASVALICPENATPDDRRIWEQAAWRAVRILGNLPTSQQVRSHDLRNHQVVVEQRGRYAYCALCHISRRVRDHKWICTHACTRAREHPLHEGEYRMVGPHLIRMGMMTWRRNALRPWFQCCRCARGWWATAREPSTCS